MKKDAKNVKLLRTVSNLFMAIAVLVGVGLMFQGLTNGPESMYLFGVGILTLVVGGLVYSLALNVANINQNLEDIRWYKQHEYNKEKEGE
jgi:hypothetical protein